MSHPLVSLESPIIDSDDPCERAIRLGKDVMESIHATSFGVQVFFECRGIIRKSEPSRSHESEINQWSEIVLLFVVEKLGGLRESDVRTVIKDRLLALSADASMKRVKIFWGLEIKSMSEVKNG